nr:ribonuclease H-like domain-containing protein [Tanacetum cinerariifolium]
MVDTFRRPSRDSGEEEQLGFLLSCMDGLILTNIHDHWVWSLEAIGEFFVKYVHQLIDDSILPKEEVAKRWVKVMPIKINGFSWRVRLDKLPTRLNFSLKDGSLSRYKACLVVNRCGQQQGIDCDETFSLVVKSATIRTVLSLAVSRDWPIHQLNVENAFLQAIFVWLKQASRAWFQCFASYATRLHVSSTTQLSAYTDADWVSCPVPRRSICGYCVFLSYNLLSWSVKWQVTLSHSSVEAEYRGVVNVFAKTSGIRNLQCTSRWKGRLDGRDVRMVGTTGWKGRLDEKMLGLKRNLRLPFGTVPSIISMEGHACGRSAWFLRHAPRCSLWSVVITENAKINDRTIDMLFGIPSSVPVAQLTTSEFEFRILTSRQMRQQQDSDP